MSRKNGTAANGVTYDAVSQNVSDMSVLRNALEHAENGN